LFDWTESVAAGGTVSIKFCTDEAEELATAEGSEEGLNSEAAGFSFTGLFVTLGGINVGLLAGATTITSAEGSTWLLLGACFGFSLLDRECFVALPAAGWFSAGVLSMSILIQ
jgi:hypothetical protein